MNSNTDNSIREDILSEYIDNLNSDEKPVSFNHDDIDDDMLDLFETVKAVKRLKGTQAEEQLVNKKNLINKRRFNNYIKIATTVAAVFVIFVSSLAIKNFVSGSFGKKSSSANQAATGNTAQDKTDGNAKMKESNGSDSTSEKPLTDGMYNFTTDTRMNDQENGIGAARSASPENANESKALMKSAPETTITASKNTAVIYEMQAAYDGITSYSGVIEIQTISNGKLVSDSEVKITYKRPDKYITTEITGGSLIKQYSDGDKLCVIDGSRVSFDFVYPEKNLWKYHIWQQIKDLEAASDIREAGSETVYGRDTQIYEYKFSGEAGYNRIWVDKKTKFPVKREINTIDGKVVNIFKELYINGEFNDSSFNYNIKTGDDVYYLNEKTTRSDVEGFVSQIGSVINSVPEYLKLQKTVKIKSGSYSYYLSFTDEYKTNFLDIYVSNKTVTSQYTPGYAHGSLQDGWTESESGISNAFKIYIGKCNTVKWIGNNYEIVMVSNIDTMDLLKILEDATNSKINSISEEQLKNMGITPKP